MAARKGAMKTARPSAPSCLARTTASATRHFISASAPGRSNAFRHSGVTPFGKTTMVRGPGVAGAMYIGESISSSKPPAAGSPRADSKRTSEPISFARIFPVLLGSVQSPHPHGQEHEQGHAGRTDDPPVGRQQFVADK